MASLLIVGGGLFLYASTRILNKNEENEIEGKKEKCTAFLFFILDTPLFNVLYFKNT